MNNVNTEVKAELSHQLDDNSERKMEVIANNSIITAQLGNEGDTRWWANAQIKVVASYYRPLVGVMYLFVFKDTNGTTYVGEGYQTYNRKHNQGSGKIYSTFILSYKSELTGNLKAAIGNVHEDWTEVVSNLS